LSLNDSILHAQGAAGARPACAFSYAFHSGGAIALLAAVVCQACLFQHQGPNVKYPTCPQLLKLKRYANEN